jgi:hypothetical protein
MAAVPTLAEFTVTFEPVAVMAVAAAASATTTPVAPDVIALTVAAASALTVTLPITDVPDTVPVARSASTVIMLVAVVPVEVAWIVPVAAPAALISIAAFTEVAVTASVPEFTVSVPVPEVVTVVVPVEPAEFTVTLSATVATALEVVTVKPPLIVPVLITAPSSTLETVTSAVEPARTFETVTFGASATPAMLNVAAVSASKFTTMFSTPEIVIPVVLIAVANAEPVKVKVSESVEELSAITSPAVSVKSVPVTASLPAVIETMFAVVVRAKDVGVTSAV